MFFSVHRTRTRRGGDERGAALVEMAVVTPLLLMLLVGIWTTARAWNVHNVIDHAAREAVRYGATVDPWASGSESGASCNAAGNSAEKIRCIADAELSASAVPLGSVTSVCIEGVKAAATGSCAPANTTGVDQVYVRLRYQNFPLDFVFWSTTVNLEATAIARYESALP